MIARVWIGRANKENNQAYLDHLTQDTVPMLTKIGGFMDLITFSREDHGQVYYQVITLWDSIDSIKQFAGPNYQTSVIPNKAADLLLWGDGKVLHFDVPITGNLFNMPLS